MSTIKRRFGNPSWFPFRDWIDLNLMDLVWIALIFGAVFVIGTFVT